jgi:hypothetical protein
VERLGGGGQLGGDVGAGEEGLRGRVGEVEGDHLVDHPVDHLGQGHRGSAGVEGAVDHRRHVGHVAGGEGLGDGLLVGEELVERPGRDPGGRGDAVGRRAVVADVGEDRGRGVEDGLDPALASLLPLRASARHHDPPLTDTSDRSYK